MNKWEFTEAEILYERVTDGTHDSPKAVSEGFPLVTSKNIKDGVLDISTANLISEEDYTEINKRSKVNQWDVVISMIGEYCGYTYIEKNANINYAVKNVGLFKTGSKLEANWLSYYLKSEYGKHFLKQARTGSSQPYIPLGALRNLKILNPQKSEKEKIVSVLEPIDSKIEINNRINSELEAMAKTLYDYWFVQFDFPNVKGKPYKSSGGKMVWNEELKREIPDSKEWSVGTLLDIAEYANGLPCQKFRPTGEEFLRVIKIREMNEGFSSNTEFVRTDIPEKSIIKNGDVLFSWSASLEVKIWTGGKGALNQHIFKVTSENYPKSFYYFQLLNYLQHFKMMAENRKTTMGHITQEHLKQSRIAIPPKELTIELDKIIAPLFAKKINNEIENQKLSELRDWLLPMLMNGQVKVGSIEDKAELRMAAEPRVKYGK